MNEARKSKGRIVLGTVAGDIHNLGKDIFSALLTCAGYTVNDLGVDVPVEKFIECLKLLDPCVLGMSALISTSLHVQREVINEMKRAGLRGKVRVIVGGAATSEEWAEGIGADAWAETASEGVKRVKNL